MIPNISFEEDAHFDPLHSHLSGWPLDLFMSGKRQHFIPRFLLEGFASHTSGDSVFTWVYRKGSRPFNTNIINVGVEGYFYTDGNDTQADDMITEAEKTFSSLVQKLRSNPPMVVYDAQIPKLIAHFEIRTRHIRESFLRTGNYLVSRLLDFMYDERSFIEYLERAFRNDPSILQKAIADELKKCGLPKKMLGPALQLSYPLLPALMKQLRPMLPKLAVHLRSVLPKALSEGAKSGHIRSLKENVAPEVRAQRYKDLIYTVVEVPQGGLILGDSIILFQVEGLRPFKTFLEKRDILNAVFLPLNSWKFMLGTRESFIISEQLLPGAIARCSLDYFVAEEESNTNCFLQDQIGEDAYPLTRAELEDIITEAIK